VSLPAYGFGRPSGWPKPVRSSLTLKGRGGTNPPAMSDPDREEHQHAAAAPNLASYHRCPDCIRTAWPSFDWRRHHQKRGRKESDRDAIPQHRCASSSHLHSAVKMGYGGSQKDAARAVGRTGDDGIDGIIKEDKLGLDVVYIQAKRWGATVGRPQIQAFAGSLEGHRARKGIFITTSRFSHEAEEYVSRIEQKIVLIDGDTLVQLMIDHGIGVTEATTYVVRKVDADYFEEDE
jgi:hypothetical protein